MSMITGCPACGTMFKVVPDQLKISDGWVRCGHCSEVFDANAQMVPPEVLRDGGVQPAAQDQAPLSDPQPVHAPPAAAMDVPGAATTLEPPAPAISELPADKPLSTQNPLPADDAQLEESPPPLPTPTPVDVALVAPDPAPTSAPAAAKPVFLSRASAANDDDEDDDRSIEDVGFIRKARRRAFWSRPAVRALLVLLALALLALLGAQVIHHERDRVAAMYPDSQAWLEKACQALGCTLGAPRRIDAIAIDSSTFGKLRGDTYRLSLTLKNQAQQPVAIPAIELTLTDTQDQPVLRRVLQPSELGAADATIASGGEWSASAAIAVAAGSSNARIAGYRLLAFYP
jgi:predicted Zn finger-like uncharacterized protein